MISIAFIADQAERHTGSLRITEGTILGCFTGWSTQRACTASSLQALVQDRRDSIPQPSEAAGIGRNWVQSMFSRDRAQLAGRARGTAVVGLFLPPSN